jgi:hypothetical protein
MVSYIGMYTRSQKGIKTRMETIIGLYDKGNEIISRHLLCVRLCLMNNNYHYVCYRRQSMLHQICTNRINNDNVCQGLKIISSDENIHSSSCVVGEKVKNLSLYVSSTFQCDSYNRISKCIMDCSVVIPTQAT